MINAIRLRNFKCFEDSGWIDIKSLNLLFGYNSSGKSSILKFFLMMKQTLESSMNDRAPLIFSDSNGVDLGSYKDVIFNGNVKKDIELSFKLSLTLLVQYFSEKVYGGFLFPMQEADDNLIVNIVFSYDEISGVVFQKRYEVLHKDKVIISIDNDGNSNFKISQLDRVNVDFNKINLSPDDFEIHIDKFILTPRIRFESNDNFDARLAMNDITVLCIVFRSVIHNFFSEMVHIGPLRTPPNRINRFTSDNPKNVGSTGAYAYNLLYNSHKNTDDEQRKLLDRVNKWLNDYNYSLHLNIIAQDIVEFQLVDVRSNNVISIVDAGFGISQVLPIVVELMNNANEVGKVVLIEQPEIHLHTKMQSELADLIIDCINLNKNNIVIVETHSENLLLRIRKNLLENQIDKLKGFDKNKLSTYYVSNDGTSSIVSNIEFSEDGSVKSENKEFDNFFSNSFNEFMEISKLVNQFKNSSNNSDSKNVNKIRS